MVSGITYYDSQYCREITIPTGVSSLKDARHLKNPSILTALAECAVTGSPSGVPGCPSGTIPRTLPWKTMPAAINILDVITSLKYNDNGFASFPFLKVTTKRVFLPILKNKKTAGTNHQKNQSVAGLSTVVGGSLPTDSLTVKVGEEAKTAILKPFPICVCPEQISYAQRSTRYVYGPWITSIGSLSFRGKIEYEQNEDLLPENFLIPTNFGDFGDFDISQISGLDGMNLAAQGRANAIDDFALFAQEQGSVSIQGPPAIKRIGDALYGVQNVTDIRVNVSNASIQTNYSFKTISPRSGKNNKEIEKKLTKISEKIKKIKFI